jgi:4-hydroxy-tetrahydrodipicolinate synthase
MAMEHFPFKGLGVAVATPFTESGEVDYEAFRTLLRHLTGKTDIAGESGGVDFLVVLGSTGEAATVLDPERRRLIEIAREEAPESPLCIGTGTNATARTVELTRDAVAAGADSVLVVTPFYNKPGPEGIYAHFAKAAEAAGGKPVIAYNVPGRTGLNMAPAVISRLWTIPHLDALKESSGNLAQIGEILRTIPEGKYLLSGDDALALPAISLGGSGLISVLGNLLPRRVSALVRAALSGANEKAQKLQRELLPIMDAMFLESNPIPLKAALAMAGICSSTLRLPLTTAQPATVVRLHDLVNPIFGGSR